jgi:very-short-patch-repair endonuclease
MRLTLKDARRLVPGLKIERGARGPKELRSKYEELFRLHAMARGLPAFEREYKFALELGRQWRFDFAWPTYQVAVEIEGLRFKFIDGIPYALGRHTTREGFEEDCRKYAHASIAGWYVLRFSQRLVKDGTAVDLTRELLFTRGWRDGKD